MTDKKQPASPVDKPDIPKVLPQLTLPTVWFDNFRITSRADVPISVLSFYHGVYGVDERMEVCRLVTSTAHIKLMMDLMAKYTGYYPSKPEGSEA